MSEALLHHLNRNKTLTVSGLPWIAEESRIVSPKALASRILCDRHNSALSPLDENAVRFFQAFDEGNAHGTGQRLLNLFNGHDLERWLLKILCGLAASNGLTLDPGADCDIPHTWLKILFGTEPFPHEQGLYVCKSVGHRLEGPHGLKFQPISAKGKLTGMGFWICGYELILSMSGFPRRIFDGREVAYRPFGFHASGRDYEKSVILSWDGPADLGTLSLRIAEA